MTINRGLLIGLLSMAGLLGGCAAHGYGYAAYNVPPPPAPMYEGPYGAVPGPGYVWTAGFYDLRGSNWVWVRGRYMRPPHRRSVWVTPRWEQTRHGWTRHPGYWR